MLQFLLHDNSVHWNKIKYLETVKSHFSGIQEHLLRIVKSSKAPSTNKKYDIYFSKFKNWCIVHSLRFLPADISIVAVYINTLVQDSVSVLVLQAHVYIVLSGTTILVCVQIRVIVK